nr:MAG TPA: hypothetical protein [Caudoviricetes sp.]
MTDLFVVAALCAVDLILIWTIREMEERMDIMAAAVLALGETVKEAVRDADQI